MFYRAILAPFRLFLRDSNLILNFTKRSIELNHKGSYFGHAWSVVQPLLTLGVYVFVFGFVFEGKFTENEEEGRLAYGMGIFVGLTYLHFFSNIFASATSVIVGNPNFVKKVVFPLHVLPHSVVLKSMFHLIIGLILVLIGVLLFNPESVLHFWVVLLFFPCLFFLGSGIAFLISAFTVYVKDLNQIIGFMVICMMFSSAIFYPVADIPLEAWTILKFNPLIHIVETSRSVILWQGEVSWGGFIYCTVLSLVTYVLGFNIFEKMKLGFADVM